ncbi:MAG: hypothetical protein ACRDWY_16740 [Actinomycetes bacterium]
MRLHARLRDLRSATPDRGDIVLSWLTKITVVLGIAGIGLFDAISIGTTSVNLSDQGAYAAREASEVWQSTNSVQKAYDAAVAAATEQNSLNVVDTKSFRIDEDNTVHVTVRREATTILLYRWGRTAEWAKVEQQAHGRSVA